MKRAALIALLASPLALAIGLDLPLCPSASLLGMPCPGCGLTRATFALLRGDFGAAYRLHPLVFVLTPVYTGLLALIGWSYVRGGTAPSVLSSGVDWGRRLLLGRVASAAAGLLIVLAFAVWIARFFGAFGGPVPVETFEHWRARRFAAAPQVLNAASPTAEARSQSATCDRNRCSTALPSGASRVDAKITSGDSPSPAMTSLRART